MENAPIINLLDSIADRQSEVFRVYQENGIWSAAQADPASAISQIDMDIVVFHQVFSIWFHRDLDNAAAREIAARYVSRQNQLLDLADAEMKSGRYGRKEDA